MRFFYCNNELITPFLYYLFQQTSYKKIMDSQETSFTGLNFSRTQSNQSLSGSSDYFSQKRFNQLGSAHSPSKNSKLDAILRTIKTYKNSQSTTDLHSGVQTSKNYSNISNQSIKKCDESVTFDKKRSFCLAEVKQKSIKKYQLNSPSKKYLQTCQKQENSYSQELKQVLSLESLKKIKKSQIIMCKNDISGHTTSSKNLFRQSSPKPIFSLEFQKSSIQAIKEKLQKYGINTSKNNIQSRVNLNKSQKYPQRQMQQRQIQDLRLASSGELSPNLIKEIKEHLKQEQKNQEDSASRPLTSLMEKNVPFYEPIQFSTQTNFRKNTSSIKTSILENESRISAQKSIVLNSSAKSKEKSVSSKFLESKTQKKSGSFAINEKSKLVQSDYNECNIKQKPGSYGNRKSIKSIFEPTSSFSINSEAPSLNLKETIETNCTMEKLEKKLTIKDFLIGRQIGKGKFGRVYICTHRQSGFLCAMKIIKKDLIRKQRNIEQLIRQIKIQSYLNHANSVKMYTFFDDTQNIYLLIEYCIEGQLYSLLKVKKRFQEEQAIPVIRDICEGLSHLHQQGVIHRDVKPQNVVISFQISKLCDFGWSVNSQNQKRQTFCGTPLYVSPELLMGKTYDYKVDIWALGIMVYELLTGKLPFQISNEKELRKIVTNQIEYPEHLSDNAKNFIQHLLQKNPNYRNDMDTILKHRFLVQGIEKIKQKLKTG